MRDGNCKKSKVSWPKTLVKKWLNIKSKADDFQADDVVSQVGGYEESRDNFSEREACTVKKSRTERSSRRCSDLPRRSKIDLDTSQVTDLHNFRIFAATWNVGGKSPPNQLSLEDWLRTSPPADIYVLGFQEIVPLNAGNVLGSEDNLPARKWLALIRKTLNNPPGSAAGCKIRTPSPVPNPKTEPDSGIDGSTTRRTSSFLRRKSFHSLSRSMRMMTEGDVSSSSQPHLDRRFSVCDRVTFGNPMSDCYHDPNFRWIGYGSSDEDNEPDDSPPVWYGGSMSMEEREREREREGEGEGEQNFRYCLVASKQMVGIFLTVWVKGDIRNQCHNMKASCVGRGLMGYLGNKGSISISMSLHQTSFCFVCSHLTSGQKEGDELRRNSDVMEILRKTRFPGVQGAGDENLPETILDHDRIIWLGDLNYRIALSYRSAKALVEMRNWRALLENDQLRIEHRMGRVFQGWNEGRIYFPPTYKYSNNSDRYAGYDLHPKEKRRTPAWCDRILWYGRGLHQMSYVRGESRFSDHRPVYSIFLAEVESTDHGRIRKNTSCSRVEVEELLPFSLGFGDLSFF